MKTIPDRFASNSSDKLMGAFDQLGEMMIQMQLEFDHSLDVDRLSRAVDLVMDAEPVLGCRYVGGHFRSYWQRLTPDERDVFRVVCDQRDYDRFIQAPMDHEAGPQLRVCLLQQPSGDRLFFKFSHLAGDSAGLKDSIASVASIYRRLPDDPEYRPDPNIDGSRGLGQVIRQVPVSAFPQVWRNARHEARSKGKPRVTHALRLIDESGDVVRTDTPVFLTRHLTSSQVSDMTELGRECNAKINDAVVAAFLRALQKTVPKPPGAQLRLQTTVDLRRWYLPDGKSGGICNLSFFEYPNLGEDPGADFLTTLERVSRFTQERKANWIGMSSFLGEMGLLMLVPRRILNFFFRRVSFDENSRNLLTNMGPIDVESVTFDNPPAYAFMLVPPLYAPALGFGLSGYDGRLTLSTAVPEEFVLIADQFLDAFVAEWDAGIAARAMTPADT